MIYLYNLLYCLLCLFAFPVFFPVALLSEKRRKTVLQRLGLIAPSAESHSLSGPVWVHALSVGEVHSAIPLVREMRRRFPRKQIVFSTSTKTGFEVAEPTFRDTVDHVIFFPYDFLFSVKFFLGRIRPELVVIVETDIWPNFLTEIRKRKIPVLLVNARLSLRSLNGYRKFSFFITPLFHIFARICTQSPQDTRRFHALGIEDSVITTGNIKFDQPVEDVSDMEKKRFREMVGAEEDRKIFIAGSTHKGEEALLSKAFSVLKNRFPDLLFVVAPRHAERARAVRRIFQAQGLDSLLMQEIKENPLRKRHSVTVVDVTGVLKKLYAVSDAAFVGGSLVPSGGHNPLEPAAFAKPVLFGPDMSDFALVSEMLMENGGGIQVSDADAVVRTVEELLKDESKATESGRAAFRVFDANKGAVERTLGIVSEALKGDLRP